MLIIQKTKIVVFSVTHLQYYLEANQHALKSLWVNSL